MRIAAMGRSGTPMPDIPYRGVTPLDDFDAVVWNPNALLADYAGALEAEGALSVRASDQFLADLRRRRGDFLRYLDDGGIVIIEPPAPRSLRVHTLETIIEIPLNRALPVEVATIDDPPGALVFHGGEPFLSFWHAVGSVLEPRFRLSHWTGEPLLFGDDGTGVFGTYVAYGRGHILFLPPPRGGGERCFFDGIGALIEALAVDQRKAPPWLATHIASDEKELRQEVERLTAERLAIDRRLAELGRALHPFERRKALFTASGRDLVDAVADAFGTLGCSAYQGPFADTDLVIEAPNGVALANIVGSNGELPAQALTDLCTWLDRYAQTQGPCPKGLLIANPFRLRPPAERPALDPALLRAAEAKGVLVVTGCELFDLLVGVGQSHSTPAALLQSLFRVAGKLPQDKKLG